MRNIELKAHCLDIGHAARICQELGCVDSGLEEQVDTYYKSRSGRLKLREGSQAESRLIYYEREDEASARTSDYMIYPVPEASDTLKQILCLALTVRTTVRKLRHVFLLGQLRIHLDEVEELGNFIELEYVVDETTDVAGALSVVDDMCKPLSIDRSEIIPQSYIDLIEEVKTE